MSSTFRWWEYWSVVRRGDVCWLRDSGRRTSDSTRPSPAINKCRRATRQWILFMTESREVTPKTTEQDLIVGYALVNLKMNRTVANFTFRQWWCWAKEVLTKEFSVSVNQPMKNQLTFYKKFICHKKSRATRFWHSLINSDSSRVHALWRPHLPVIPEHLGDKPSPAVTFSRIRLTDGGLTPNF